jgi:acyl-CoA thioesterase FadM
MPEATTRVRVGFVDVDSSQRIHFTAMFRYMEAAEHELMRAIGFPYATALSGAAMPRVHLECDFRASVVYDVSMDPGTERATPIPPELRRALAAD